MNVLLPMQLIPHLSKVRVCRCFFYLLLTAAAEKTIRMIMAQIAVLNERLDALVGPERDHVILQIAQLSKFLMRAGLWS